MMVFFINMKNVLYILLIIIILLIVFGAGFFTKSIIMNNTKYENCIVRIDSIYITDTVIKPIPKYIDRIKYDTIITPNDTVYIPIEKSEIIHNINTDSIKGTIKAVYSGYNASIDTLIYNLSFQQKTLLKRRKMGFTVGLTGGVGYDFNNKVTPFIGVGVTWGYNF